MKKITTTNDYIIMIIRKSFFRYLSHSRYIFYKKADPNQVEVIGVTSILPRPLSFKIILLLTKGY